MKNLFVLVITILSFPFLNISQEIERDEKTGMAKISKIIEVDSMSSQQLFDHTMKWIKLNYANPENVISTTIGNEFIRGNGVKQNITSSGGLASNLRYLFKFDFKENRVRILYTDFVVRTGTNLVSAETYFYKKNGDLKKGSLSMKMKYAIQENIYNLIKNYENSLLYGFSDNSDESDDW